MADDKPQYAKPASQVDLEARLDNGNASDRVLSTSDNYEPPEPGEDERTYMVEGNKADHYIGTSTEYVNYANETEKPGFSEESAEDQVAEEYVKAAGSVSLAPGEYEETNAGGQPKSSDEGSKDDGSKDDDSKDKPPAKKTASSSQKS